MQSAGPEFPGIARYNPPVPNLPTTPEEMYLDLLKRTLSRYAFGDSLRPFAFTKGSVPRAIYAPLRALLDSAKVELVRRVPFDPALRAEGRDWPPDAETMIGMKRLDNLQACVTDVIRRKVSGDLIETGVWRGGAAIFMKGILRACGDTSRTVWVADSFRGLPKPDGAKYPADAGDEHWVHSELAVSVAQVKANFERYGLLDDRVRFLEGWFKDTLPKAPIQRLAIARLDGDMYESTMDALEPLYDRVSVGGYLIVDDYGAVPACRQAVEDFRARRGITEPVVPIDWTGVFWRKER